MDDPSLLQFPASFLSPNVTDEIPGTAQAEQQYDGNSHNDASDWDHILLKPCFTLLNAALHVDHMAGLNVQTILISDSKSTLNVDYSKLVAGLAAGKRNPATFHAGRRTVEVDVLLPVIVVFESAAVQPFSLNPVNEVLKVGVVSIIEMVSLNNGLSEISFFNQSWNTNIITAPVMRHRKMMPTRII